MQKMVWRRFLGFLSRFGNVQHSLEDLARQFQARACNTLAFRAVARTATH